MEHRTDLEQILLDGLPKDERQHVELLIRLSTLERIRHLQSEGLRDNASVRLDQRERSDSRPF